MVSKWVITPIYPIYRQVITHLLTIYYLPGTSKHPSRTNFSKRLLAERKKWRKIPWFRPLKIPQNCPGGVLSSNHQVHLQNSDLENMKCPLKSSWSKKNGEFWQFHEVATFLGPGEWVKTWPEIKGWNGNLQRFGDQKVTAWTTCIWCCFIPFWEINPYILLRGSGYLVAGYM